MLAWTQTWFTVHLQTGSAVRSTVDADGASVVPQYTALAIASLALFLAMTIAGPVVRIVLACIEVLLGSGRGDRRRGALRPGGRGEERRGRGGRVSDLGAVRPPVSSVDVSAWPAVGIVGGALAVALGVVVLVVQRSWPGPSRKYGAATAGAQADARAAAPVQRDAVVDWDDLSAGVDPTETTAAEGGAAGGVAVDDTVGSERRRSDDDAGTERGAP